MTSAFACFPPIDTIAILLIGLLIALGAASRPKGASSDSANPGAPAISGRPIFQAGLKAVFVTALLYGLMDLGMAIGILDVGVGNR